MENYYEINVSLNGSHFFATSPRSIKGRNKLENLMKEFASKFPENEGYKLEVTHWKSEGKVLII